MLSRDSFAARFGRKAVLGMVHLLPLPGAPLFAGSIDGVIDAALADARAIAMAAATRSSSKTSATGRFSRHDVDAVTIAAMTRVVGEVVRVVRLPFGVNVLRNDARAALAVAAATGAGFIRVNVHSGVMFADQGMIEGRRQRPCENARRSRRTSPSSPITRQACVAADGNRSRAISEGFAASRTRRCVDRQRHRDRSGARF